MNRVRSLIGWAERFECAISFELIGVEGDADLPAHANGVLLCECDSVRSVDGIPSVRVGFVGFGTGWSEVVIDCETGSGADVAVAALYSRARGSRSFAFEDGGETLRLLGDAAGGVAVFGLAEASRAVRIIIADENITRIGGLWSPLLPNVTALEFHGGDSSFSPRTFAGLRFSRIVIGGTEVHDWSDARWDFALAIDAPPWGIAFREGETVSAALRGRSREAITQASGFVPAECLGWAELRKCGSHAFAFARFRSFDFAPGLSAIGDRAFANSSLETVAVPDSVTEMGSGCFAGCRHLRSAVLGLGVRALPPFAFCECSSLASLTAASPLVEIGAFALMRTKALRSFDFASLAAGAEIGSDAFEGSGLCSVSLGNVSKAGWSAFAHCRMLREAAVSLPGLSIAIFSACTALEKCTLTGTVTLIGDYAFSDCSALREITFPALAPTAKISARAFAGCGFVEVILPDKLAAIESGAFRDCASLRVVRLPRELGVLRSGVFMGCLSLHALALGDVRGQWANSESLIGNGQLDRLELIGWDFESVTRRPIVGWLARDATVVSAEFAGRKLGAFGIVSP
jgi:hypothetical protein